MIQATQQGRDLHLALEGIESPFVIRPLPGRMGKHMTEQYLRIAAGNIPPDGMEDLLRIAVDGGQWKDGALVPRPENEQHVYNRIEDELSTSEAADILLPSLFWQTVLGLDGVKNYILAGGGFDGGVKTLGLLLSTLALSPSKTSPSSELETLIRSQADTSTTTTPNGGGTLAKLPEEKRSRFQRRRRQTR